MRDRKCDWCDKPILLGFKIRIEYVHGKAFKYSSSSSRRFDICPKCGREILGKRWEQFVKTVKR